MTQRTSVSNKNAVVLKVIEHMYALLDRSVILFVVGQIVHQVVSADLDEEPTGTFA